MLLMIEGVGPTLAEDEATLAGYATALIDAVDSVAASWLLRLVTERAPTLADSAQVFDAVETSAASLIVALREQLGRDISEQTTGPLEILRTSVGFATAILTDAGVPVVERGDFEVRNFPDDVYNLTPASFADVHPDLHEPGLMWGAAKAHVHLRRRRESAG